MEAAAGSTHFLWIEIRGELWRANATGNGDSLLPGTLVDVVSLDGLIAQVVPAVGDSQPAHAEMRKKLTRSRMIGFGLWGFCVLLGAPAFGALIWGVISVPIAVAVFLLPMLAMAV